MATATATKKPKSKKASTGRVTVRDAAQNTTDKMIEALKGGKIPWQKDWMSAEVGMPISLATGKRYGGSNVLVLWLAGYTSPYWGTYAEMAKRAGMVWNESAKRWFSPLLADGTVDPTPRGVRKGERSTEIIRWITIDKEVESKVTPGRMVKDSFLVPRIFHVFNAEQCEFPEGCKGVPQTKVVVREPKETIEGAQELTAAYLADGPSLGHGGNSAHYVPARDHVQMPAFDDFNSAEGYFSTLYHELTHSTGHASRLNREGIAKGTFGGFGSKTYSFEELVAELGAAMLCALAGIEQKAVFDNSTAYIQHWIAKLGEDKNLIIRAASQATKAVTRIVGEDEATTDNEEGEA